MDDPWGSPWATDGPPRLDLPAAPPNAHFSIDETSTHHRNSRANSRSPAGRGTSPWGKDDEVDAFGGWNDAGSRVSSPGWPKDQGPRRSGQESRAQLAPDPWAGDVSARAADSAVSLSLGVGDDGGQRRLSTGSPLAAADPWGQEDLTKDKGIQDDELGIPRTSLEVDDDLTGNGPRALVTPLNEPQVREPKSPDSQAFEDDSSFEVAQPWKHQTQLEPHTHPDQIDDSNHLGTATAPTPTLPRIPPPSEPFAIDLTHLTTLFPSALPAAAPESVPDVIIDDTFATISERKAWHRMSRPGSIRKHNLGSEVHATWQGSTVRYDTIRIVRRWMEEDSIAGRVVLGRKTGPVGASMFGWGAEGPAVDVEELFKKGRHIRNVSQASRQTVESTAPAFGWSSSNPSSPASSAPLGSGPEVKPRVDELKPVAGVPIKPLRPQSLDAVVKTAVPPLPVAAKSEVDQQQEEEEEGEDDDDDDWGEMVSSSVPKEDSETNRTPPATNGVSISPPLVEPVATTKPKNAPASDSEPPPASASAFTQSIDDSLTPRPTSRGLTNGTIDDHSRVPPSQSKSLVAIESTALRKDHPSASASAFSGPDSFSHFHGETATLTTSSPAPTATNGATPDAPILGSKRYPAIGPVPTRHQQPPPSSDSAFSGLDSFEAFHGAASSTPAQTLTKPPPVPKKMTQPKPARQAASTEDEDIVVRNILGGLPDLSYMLR